MKKINIAVDGFSACGKSTTAKAIARELGYSYIDSGAMYRAVTLYFLNNNITITNPKEVVKALDDISITFERNSRTGDTETFLNGLRVEEEIRTMIVTEYVSQVSTLLAVRRSMVSQQRKYGRKKGVVMEGRDIGTVVFPDAELKIFMVAERDVRAERRQKEFFDKDQLVNYDVILENLIKRDKIDSTRNDSPLMRAEGSELLDTTYLTTDEQIEEGLNMATRKILEMNRGNNGS